jgi:hypothetical protein
MGCIVNSRTAGEPALCEGNTQNSIVPVGREGYPQRPKVGRTNGKTRIKTAPNKRERFRLVDVPAGGLFVWQPFAPWFGMTRAAGRRDDQRLGGLRRGRPRPSGGAVAGPH